MIKIPYLNWVKYSKLLAHRHIDAYFRGATEGDVYVRPLAGRPTDQASFFFHIRTSVFEGG